VDRDALRQFARRDWSAVAASKTRHWRTLKTGRSAADVLAIAERMRLHAKQLRPEWPTPQQRLDDVRVHQRVGEALRAVAGRPR
jgi:hypothetical protein